MVIVVYYFRNIYSKMMLKLLLCSLLLLSQLILSSAVISLSNLSMSVIHVLPEVYDDFQSVSFSSRTRLYCVSKCLQHTPFVLVYYDSTGLCVCKDYCLPGYTDTTETTTTKSLHLIKSREGKIIIYFLNK